MKESNEKTTNLIDLLLEIEQLEEVVKNNIEKEIEE